MTNYHFFVPLQKQLNNYNMDTNRAFIKTLNDYYDGNNDCNSIIIPNTFGIRKVDCDLIIGKIDNKEIRITEKILYEF